MTTEAVVDRLGRELGDLLEEHGSGLRPGARECAKFRDDPVGFDQWGGRAPVEYQEKIMRSAAANKYTAVCGAHSTGKDWLLGSLATWAVYARSMLVLVISATERQAPIRCGADCEQPDSGAPVATAMPIRHDFTTSVLRRRRRYLDAGTATCSRELSTSSRSLWWALAEPALTG